jgi:hypothetical protein
MEKIVRTRKDHKCWYCEKIIPKGSFAYYMEGRGPVYGHSTERPYYPNVMQERQIGIEYFKVWYCNDGSTQGLTCEV